MKWHTARAIYTVAALALATVLAGQAHADCSGSQGISHDEAECLEASWDNNVDALSNGKVTAKNTCAGYGAVAVKIELASCTAIHTTLSTGSEYFINTQTCDVEEVVCCKDRGDLCNITDVVTEDSCLDRFSQSPAAETCREPSASVLPVIPVSIPGYDAVPKCDISAYCQYAKTQSGATLHEWTGINVNWLQVPDVYNCGGVLRLGAC